MFRAQWRTLVALTITIVLSACAGLPSDSQRRTTTDSVRPLGPPVEQFSISGRLVLKQGQRRDHLRFTWDHAPTADTMLLSGPLGQGVARLTRDAQARPPARLELADGKSYAAVDWQALAQQVFGQALPLDALPQWLRGAHAGWTGDQDQWRIVVTEASERKATAYPLRGTSGHAASLGRQHQLMPRALQISAEDVMVNIIVESWGDDDE